MNNKNSFLEDYKNIWTKFCFLDESGNLANPKEPFFTVGIIKCSQPLGFSTSKKEKEPSS